MSEERVTSAVLVPEEDDLDASLRPRRLDDFVGQERVKEQLAVALEAPRWLARGCAVAIGLVSAVTFAELVFGVNAGIDEILGPS